MVSKTSIAVGCASAATDPFIPAEGVSLDSSSLEGLERDKRQMLSRHVGMMLESMVARSCGLALLDLSRTYEEPIVPFEVGEKKLALVPLAARARRLLKAAYQLGDNGA